MDGLYHDVLSSLDEVEIEQEITKSINLLEVSLEEKIFHYSYPEGQLEHYNDRIIKTLKEQNIGVLITDHNVRETLHITDRAYLLYEGEILKEGTAKELIADKDAQRLYLGNTFKEENNE